MSGYYYECPACSEVHPISGHAEIAWFTLPSRACGTCGADGCSRCIPDTVCVVCETKKKE